jgi:chromosome segregation ATPase
MIDTLKLSRRLEGAGMDRRPAEELADALADGLREAVVERIDRLQASMDSRFERMQAQIDARFERVQAQIDVLKSDIIDLKADVRLLKWGNGVVLAGVVAILLKLFLG